MTRPTTGFSIEWDRQYRRSRHLSAWPWSDLVSLVMRFSGGKVFGPGVRILELGFGAGANFPFFKALGASYSGVDGSMAATRRALADHPDLEGRLRCADFTKEIPFAGPFDLVVDRAALTCNPGIAIERCLSMVRVRLRPGGRFIGVDWYSTRNAYFRRGRPGPDPRTRRAIAAGPFAGTGDVHFSDEAHLRRLFAGFRLLYLEHKSRVLRLPRRNGNFASWDLVAEKP